MQKIAVSKMKNYISRFTDNRVRGLLVGIVATFFMQSSTATSIIVVGLVSGSVLTLWQALGVMLGSSIGTSLTVQVLAFDVTKYASIFIFSGAILFIFARVNKLKLLGQSSLGVGFLFFGIGIISSTLAPLGSDPSFVGFMVKYESIPLIMFSLSVLFTVLMHSSAATIVLCMTLISTGVLSFTSAIPIVLGANLGATIPALISSLASTREGKKVALSYFLFKFIAVLLAFLCYGLIAESIGGLPGGVERQIANMHTLFNIGTAAIFLPILYNIARLMDRILPSKEEAPSIELDYRLLELPDEALFQAKKEIAKVSQKIQKNMVEQLRQLLKGENAQHSVQVISDTERELNRDYLIILQFLLRLGQENLSPKQSDIEVKCLYVLNDLEHIGDIINQIAIIFQKMEVGSLMLNEADKRELVDMSNRIISTYKRSLTAFELDNLAIAKEVIKEQGTYDKIKNNLIFNHFNHLIEEKSYNSNLSASHLELINQLYRVHQHSVHISQTVLGIV